MPEQDEQESQLFPWLEDESMVDEAEDPYYDWDEMYERDYPESDNYEWEENYDAEVDF
jgi:hypothetical protein